MRFVNFCYRRDAEGTQKGRRRDAVYEMCNTWVLEGTHIQCMRFVNICYRRETVYEVCKTWMLKGTYTMYEVCKLLFFWRDIVYEMCNTWVLEGTHIMYEFCKLLFFGGTQCMRCVKLGC